MKVPHVEFINAHNVKTLTLIQGRTNMSPTYAFSLLGKFLQCFTLENRVYVVMYHNFDEWNK
jgi:hypothetical protein